MNAAKALFIYCISIFLGVLLAVFLVVCTPKDYYPVLFAVLSGIGVLISIFKLVFKR